MDASLLVPSLSLTRVTCMCYCGGISLQSCCCRAVSQFSDSPSQAQVHPNWKKPTRSRNTYMQLVRALLSVPSSLLPSVSLLLCCLSLLQPSGESGKRSISFCFIICLRHLAGYVLAASPFSVAHCCSHFAFNLMQMPCVTCCKFPPPSTRVERNEPKHVHAIA